MPQLMLIDGERVASVSGEYFDVQDPATEGLLDQAPMGNEEDARAAIAAANEAFKSWRKVSAHEKAELLHEVARKIRVRTEELATLLTREGGKPLIENRDEIGWSAACFDYYAELQRNTRGQVIPDYGLGANLYSNDPRTIKQYYEEVKAGTCWVNDR